jgi:hypothetical protein
MCQLGVITFFAPVFPAKQKEIHAESGKEACSPGCVRTMLSWPTLIPVCKDFGCAKLLESAFGNVELQPL